MLLLFGDELAVGAKPIAGVRFGGPLLFRCDGGGNERKRDELAVEMGDRCAGSRALVLEDETVAELAIVTPVGEAGGVGFQNAVEVIRCEHRQAIEVGGALDENFVGPRGSGDELGVDG